MKAEYKNVAFKMNYNDGNKTKDRIGFTGTCSNEIIIRNIKMKRNWCSADICECKQYYDKGFISSQKPVWPCYESRLLIDWQGTAGYELRTRKPRKIRQTIEGKIGIFTTIFPYKEEIDRRIIGVFLIADIIDREGEATILVAHKDYRIELAPDEKLYLWKYYSTQNRPGIVKWGHGLFRYLKDDAVKLLLLDLKNIKNAEQNSEELYNKFCGKKVR